MPNHEQASTTDVVLAADPGPVGGAISSARTVASRLGVFGSPTGTRR